MTLSTADWYAGFAAREAAGNSPTYERLGHAVAGSSRLIGLLDTLPEHKRQPNLLFASVRYLGGPVAEPAAFEHWVLEHWESLSATMRSKLTQTNEPRRCATLLPFLSRIEGPIALLEVGASAGLCLYPDRWRYQYGDAHVGDPSVPPLSCAPIGIFRPPARLPEVVWRAGVDLNPLDVTDPDHVRWLEALIWPEQGERLDRLHGAISIARADPPHLVAGDLNDELGPLAAKAPSNATLVIFHSAVLTYLLPVERKQFVTQVADLPGHWISNEGPAVLPEVAAKVPAGREDTCHRFLTAVDGQPVAWSGGHGQNIELL